MSGACTNLGFAITPADTRMTNPLQRTNAAVQGPGTSHRVLQATVVSFVWPSTFGLLSVQVCCSSLPGVDRGKAKPGPFRTGVQMHVNTGGHLTAMPHVRFEPAHKPWWRRRATVLGCLAVATAVGSGLVACSPGSAPTSLTADVPLQAGRQTELVDEMGATTVAVDAKNILYLGSAFGILTLTPGADEPTPLEHGGFPASAMAAAPDGTLYFVTVDNVVEKLPPRIRHPGTAALR